VTIAAATVSAAVVFGPLFGLMLAWPGLPVIPVSVTVALLLAGVTYPFLRATAGDRAKVLVWIAVLGALPALFMASVRLLAVPFIENPGAYTCGTGHYHSMLRAWMVTAAIGALGFGVSTGLATLSRDPGRRMRVLAVLAFFATALFTGAGAIGAMRSPHSGAWAGSLPELARIPATSTLFDASRTRVTPSVALERVCDEYGCAIDLIEIPAISHGPIGEELEPPRACENNDDHCPRMDTSADHRALSVRHDPRSGIFVVESEFSRIAYGSDLAPMEVRSTDVASSISAPRSILWTGLFAVVLALFAFAMRAPIVKQMRRIERTGRSGIADEDGITFDDGQLPARGVFDRSVPTGPVVAIPRKRAGIASYRDDGTRADWETLPGTRESILAALEVRARGWSAFAFAASVLALVPLLTAGLLFRILL
jgi:hypothetical protein